VVLLSSGPVWALPDTVDRIGSGKRTGELVNGGCGCGF